MPQAVRIALCLPAANFARFGEEAHAGSDWLRLDAMDGQSTPDTGSRPLIVSASRRMAAEPGRDIALDSDGGVRRAGSRAGHRGAARERPT